jgi:hypothetical protein
LVFLVSPAAAWVETVVRSHEARVDVHGDGKAIVRHELVLKVRGGPMKILEVGGVGSISDTLPDAIVRRAVEGSAGTWPLSVAPQEDGSLRLGIDAERGIRGGTYLFSFAYTIDLRELGRLRKTPEGIEVTFIGPRLTSGVDSAKVTFSVPRGNQPPVLGRQEETGAEVMLGEVRRGAETDEVELVRAHLATGEPAIWKVVVAEDVLSPSVWGEDPAGLATSAGPSAQVSSDLRGESHLLAGLVSAGLGVIFGLLSFFKGHFTRLTAQRCDARIKPLLPGTPTIRALVVALNIGLSSYLVQKHEPWWAMVTLSVACVACTHLLPVRIVRPRGPGVWEPLEDGESPHRKQLPGRIFETKTLPGFLTFTVLILGIFAWAYRMLPSSNYLAVTILALSVPLVPLFWTGRHQDFPQLPAEQARPWVRFLTRAVDEQIARVELWGRRASVSDEALVDPLPLEAYDEARVRVLLKDAPLGLRALEVSFDEAAGSCVLPCVVVRVLEDSPALRALPADVPWQRGRAVEERVAVLRPTAPTHSQLLRLIRTLVGNLRAAAHYSRNKAAKSSGRGSSTSKVGTPSALHAT